MDGEGEHHHHHEEQGEQEAAEAPPNAADDGAGASASPPPDRDGPHANGPPVPAAQPQAHEHPHPHAPFDPLADPGGLQYTPKNILITGGAGFIGSHVALLLVKKYPHYRIVVLDKLDYCASLDNLKEVEPLRNFKFVKGDICSSDLVNYLLEEESIDTIMHFAAQTHVDNSFGNSFSFTQNNILGTHVLLESANAYGIKRFIHVSTDEVYGEGQSDQEPMFEDQVLEPTNPYAATKAGAEFIAKSYSRSFNLPLIITRGNNVYGPHQFPEKLIPKFVNLLMRNRPVTLHGNGLNTRNYLYVKDVASAFDYILHRGVAGKIYNIGGSNEKSNIEVAREIVRRMGLGDRMDQYLSYVEDRAFNDLRYTVNSSALKQLGWREMVPWDEGLQMTIDWYRDTGNSGRWGSIEDALVAHPSGGPFRTQGFAPHAAGGAAAAAATNGV